MPRLWAKLQKKVDWDDQVALADQVHFGCTQRAAQVNSRNVMEKQLLFSKLITTSTDVKTEDVTAWSFDMEGHVQKCVVERYCVVAHKAVDRHHNVSTLSLDDHSYDCTQQQLEDQTYFGLNFLARSVTKWNRACDPRLARLIRNIHHTTDYKTVLSRLTSSNKLRTGIIPRRRFCRKSNRLNVGWRFVYLWITYVCTKFMAFQKRSAVSHSTTDAEITQLDAGLRMMGFPAMNLWDTIIDMLHPQAGGDAKPGHQTQILKHQEPFGDIDCVPPNARLCSMRAS